MFIAFEDSLQRGGPCPCSWDTKGCACFEAREDEEMFNLHSLMRLAARGSIGAHVAAQDVRDAALAQSAALFRTDDWDERGMWRQSMPHVLHVIRIEDGGTDRGGDECKLECWGSRCLIVERQSGTLLSCWRTCRRSHEDAGEGSPTSTGISARVCRGKWSLWPGEGGGRAAASFKSPRNNQPPPFHPLPIFPSSFILRPWLSRPPLEHRDG